MRLTRYIAVCGVSVALLLAGARAETSDARGEKRKKARKGSALTGAMVLSNELGDPASGSSLLGRMWGALAELTPQGLFNRVDLHAYRILRVPPVVAPRSSGFGWRFHPVLKRRKIHKGLDYRANLGTPVRAAAAGQVAFASTKGTYGKLVIIDHGSGIETRYAHLHRLHVKRGEFVAAGARIGLVGATGRVTGAHLHFEVRIRDQAVDPSQCFSAIETASN